MTIMAKHKKKHSRKPLNPTVQLIMAALLFIVATIASRPAAISTWETGIFNAIYDLPRALYPVFYVITQLGSIYMLAALLVLYVTRSHWHIVLRLLLTGTLAYLLAGIAKGMWGRARPDELLPSIIALDYFQGAGFPSGHMALAVALALTIGHYIPKKFHWLIVLWIVGVGLSRVYLGVHAPLDIVGGFAVGWFCYAIFRHVRIYDIAHPKKRQTIKT